MTGRGRLVRKSRAQKQSKESAQEALEAVTQVTPIKLVHNDKMSKDTCTLITKHLQTTKDHGLVNQDDTLKSAEKPPEQETNIGLMYK